MDFTRDEEKDMSLSKKFQVVTNNRFVRRSATSSKVFEESKL
jgi:hypothetical protein